MFGGLWISVERPGRRLRKHCRTVVGTLAAVTALGCDSTVGLDATRSTLNDLLVPGACRVSGFEDLSEIDVSVILVGDQEAILPDTKVQRETEPVGGLLTPSSFGWARLSGPDDVPGTLPGLAQGVMGGATDDVDLKVKSVEFRYNGGAERRGDPRLVVFLIDSSGSLRGRDIRTGEVDDNKASDKDDQRFAFFNQLLGAMPRNYYVSLVSFNNEIPNIDPGDANDGPAVPTRNRDIIEQAISDIEQAEEGATPLARALRDTKSSIIDSNTDLNPVVVLLTDGVEEGDPTDDADRSRLKEAIAAYEAAKIPVIVLQLQPPVLAGTPRERDPLLVDLACRTGGEFLFLEQPEEFTASESQVSSIVRHRLVGSWVVRTQTTLSNASFGPDSYFISSELTVTLGGETQPERLARSRDQLLDFLDTRLWLVKP